MKTNWSAFFSKQTARGAVGEAEGGCGGDTGPPAGQALGLRPSAAASAAVVGFP